LLRRLSRSGQLPLKILIGSDSMTLYLGGLNVT
jgi:hypothetical protein